GNAEVPLALETISQNGASFLTSVPQFRPTEIYDPTNAPSVRRVDAGTQTITLPYDHGLTTGDAVFYRNDAAGVGGGANIGGLTSGTTYYAIVVDASTLRLATTQANALAGDAIPLSLTGTDNGLHSLYPGFNPTAGGAVNTANKEINVGFEHGLLTGQPVTYRKGDGAAQVIGGLTHGSTYHVVVTGDQTFRLANSAADALAAELTESTDSLITLTSTGSGLGHSFEPQFFDDLPKSANLRVLDSNNDGQITAADARVTSVTYVPTVGATIQTDQNLLLLAEDATTQFSGTGAISRTVGSGAGLSFSVDVISRKTEAFVGAEEYALDDEPFAPGLGINSENTLVLDYAHGFNAGDRLVYSSGGDFTIGGLNDRDVYAVTTATTNTLTLGRSTGEATAQFGATGVTDSLRTINLGYDHGFHDGDAVVYRTGGGTEVGGLEDGKTYYVSVVDATTIALAASQGDALSRDEFRFVPFSDISNSQIYLGYNHGLTAGQPLIYRSGGGSDIGGLTNGDVYFVKSIPNETRGFELMDANGTKITLNAAAATGVNHSFHPGFVPSTNVTIAGVTPQTNQSVDLGYAHGLITGDPVIYERGTNIQDLGSLVDGNRYYAIVLSDTRIALASSEVEANSGRQRFIDANQLLDNGDATDPTKFDTFDVYTEHGYNDGDTLIYFQNGGTSIGLTDGAAYTVRNLDMSSSLGQRTTKFQLVDSNNDLVELTASPTAFDMQYFMKVSGRVSLGVSPPVSSTPHFIQPDLRLDLDTTSTTGTNHSLRLALDATVTSKNTHGFARGFTASAALSDSDGDADDDTIDLGYAHGYVAGQAVLYSSGQGNPLLGLSEGQIYYVIPVMNEANQLQLAATAEDALASQPVPIELEGSSATGNTHAIQAQFRPNVTVDGPTNTIDFGRLHGLSNGDTLKYSNGGGTSIGGLDPTLTYTVIRVDGQRIQLSTSSVNPTPVEIDPTVATGTAHTFGEASEVQGQVDTGGSVLVSSANTGGVIAVTIAGTVSAPSKPGEANPGAAAVQYTDPAADFKRAGTNVSGTVTISVIADITRAGLNDANLIGAGAITVDALNDTSISMGAGAITYATKTTADGSSAADSSKGLAGSLAINVLAGRTEAFIDNSSIDVVGDVTLDADANGRIIAIAISGSGANGTLAAA
ncbi:MAG: hypothetical protein AAGF97_13605, partial [Planctomycetota bacterium]